MACSVTINLPILISAVHFILSLDANNALIKYTIKLKNNQTGVLNSSSLTNCSQNGISSIISRGLGALLGLQCCWFLFLKSINS